MDTVKFIGAELGIALAVFALIWAVYAIAVMA